MTFKPYACSDRWYGLLAILGLLLVDFSLVLATIGRPVSGLSFVIVLWVLTSLVIAAYLAYRTWGAFTLEYWVDRDAVTLVWGLTRQVVPLEHIGRVQVGVDAQDESRPRPWHWPCAHRRRMQCTDGLGVVNAYATRPLREQVLLETAGESYSLTPQDAQGFVHALQVRHALGPTRTVLPHIERPPLWTWPLWRDEVALALIGFGLLGLLLMFGVLCFRFPYLSSDLPLHFDVNGQPDRIEAKSGLFALPIIGLIAWAVNLGAGIILYRRVQQGAAYLLWGGALVVEGIAGLALFNLMRW
jgi:hypothetical protein